MKRPRTLTWYCGIWIAALLSGCASPTPLPTPSPTEMPSATPAPSSTPLPPPPTLTPSVTPTPLPSPTPTERLLALPGTALPVDLAPITAVNASMVSGLAAWQQSDVTDLAWSPQGGRLAAASFAAITIYDAPTRQQVGLFDAPGGVTTIAYSPQGNFLASGQQYGSEQTGYDGDVDFWRLPQGERLDILYTGSRSVSKVAFSPTGRTFAAALGGPDVTSHQVVLWDTVTWEITRTLSAGVALDIAFSPDGLLFATTPDRYAVKLWQLKNGQPLHKLHSSFTGAVTCLDFSPDGLSLASGHYDGVIRLWDVSKGSLVLTIQTGAVVQSLDFSPDGSLLASGHGYEDSFVRLHDPSSGQLLRTLDGHTHGVDSLAFSPGGQYLASASYDGAIILWGLRP